MPASINEIIELINSELEKPGQGGVVEVRKLRLQLVKDFLATKGFPQSMRERFELALHPFYFQEVNYDDLDPYSKNGDLGQLKNVYNIDLAVQTGGFTRENISDADFCNYWRRQTGVIAWRQGHPRLRDRLLLMFSRIRAK